MSNTPLEQNGVDLDTVLEKINALPQAGIIPSGSITLTEENAYDVTEKATAVVDFSATRANLAEAVTAKGVDTLPDSSFDTIAANIGLIEGSSKIGTATTNPQGGTSGYGQLTIPRRTGIFLCTNVSIPPNSSNRLPYALIFLIDKLYQDKATAVALTYEGGVMNWSINTTIVEENTVTINGYSTSRFLTSATYDVYQLY